MALRDKLAERTQPFLQPGEVLQQTFMAQTGLNPYVAGSLGLLGLLLGVKRYIVAVTNQSIVILKSDFNGTTPKEVAARLPRSTRIGPTSGIWYKTQLNGQNYFIHRRFHSDVQAADSAVTG